MNIYFDHQNQTLTIQLEIGRVLPAKWHPRFWVIVARVTWELIKLKW